MSRNAISQIFFNGLRRSNRSDLINAKKASGASTSSSTTSPAAQSSPQGINPNVPGLSSKCVKPASGPVGRPGASATGEYKVPEYFCYSKISFAEAEIEMAKYRCPQPSALSK